MLAAIEIPVWGAVIMAGLSVVAVLDRILAPSVRWFLRRRFLRAVDRLNKRLQLKLQPFKLMRRRDMIDRLTHDPKVMEAVVERAEEQKVPLYVAMREAERHAREIVPSFSAFAYFGFATRAAKWLSRGIFRVQLGRYDREVLERLDPGATVIFVMNHRSNMDYVLVTYLVAERSALSYAVGEWARVWPLQGLIRALGGYFIRRRYRNALYRRILARYVQMATEGGVTQAVFPEGGLTLDGRLRTPKLGLLSYILEDFEPGRSREVIFVPVGVNYDRVLEDRILLESAAAPERRFLFRPWAFVKFAARQIRLRLMRRFHRGYASVGFGDPLHLSRFVAAEGRDDAAIDHLGTALMRRVGLAVPVLPVPLVAALITRADRPLTETGLVTAVTRAQAKLAAVGAHVHVPEEGAVELARTGLRMLTRRHLVLEAPAGYSANAKEAPLLAYYGNSIIHLLPETDWSDCLEGA